MFPADSLADRGRCSDTVLIDVIILTSRHHFSLVTGGVAAELKVSGRLVRYADVWATTISATRSRIVAEFVRVLAATVRRLRS